AARGTVCSLGRCAIPRRKARDYLLPNQLNRSIDLLFSCQSGLQHKYHLVEAGFLPFLDLAADRVGIASDRHTIGDEFVIAACSELCDNRVLAAGSGEPNSIKLGIIVAVVPACHCASEVAPPAIVVFAASECKGCDILVCRLTNVARAIRVAD